MQEVEAKFLLRDAEEGRRLKKWLCAKKIGGVVCGERMISDRYFDSLDWIVLRAGWALRRRQEGSKKIVGLKSADGGDGILKRRREIEEQVSRFPKNPREVAAGELEAELRAIGRGRLRELFEVQNKRERIMVDWKGCAIEVSIDHVVVRSSVTPTKLAPGTLRFVELELELKTGSESGLAAFATLLTNRFPVLVARLSKFERGVQATGLRVPGELNPHAGKLPRLAEDKVKAGSSALLFAREELTRLLGELICEEPRAWEGLDPEGVHRMRVMSRRLRSCLQAYRKVIPKRQGVHLEHDLKWLTRLLGQVRDLDVLNGKAEIFASALTSDQDAWVQRFREYLLGEWNRARSKLLKGLQGRRYGKLIERLTGMIDELDAQDDCQQAVSTVAAQVLQKKSKALLSLGENIAAETADEVLHEFRIAAKRLRYLAEAFYPAFGKGLEQQVTLLKRIQSRLGEFQDACIAVDCFYRFADSLGGRKRRDRVLLLATGELIRSQREQARVHRNKFHRAWSKFDRVGWRNGLLESVRDVL